MRAPRGLTRLQLAVMQVLWRYDRASTAEIHQELQDRRTLALTTVATLLSRLEKRGLVERSLARRPYVYRARVREDEVRAMLTRDLLELVFRGDIVDLVDHLLQGPAVTPDDLERVRALLAVRERELEGGGGR